MIYQGTFGDTKAANDLIDRINEGNIKLSRGQQRKMSRFLHGFREDMERSRKILRESRRLENAEFYVKIINLIYKERKERIQEYDFPEIVITYVLNIIHAEFRTALSNWPQRIARQKSLGRTLYDS